MDQPSPPASTRVPIQVLILLAAALLWSIRPSPELWTLVAAYGLAWFGFNLFVPSFRSIELPWHPGVVYSLVLFALAIPLGTLLRFWESTSSNEGFHAFAELNADRSRLQKLPAISPPTVHFDHPQTHYIYAPDAKVVSLEIAPGVTALTAESLGHGLFRTRYDPRLHGVPTGNSEEITSEIITEGSRTPRRLTAVRFEAHPRWFSSSPAKGIAATVSEETDEVYIVSRTALKHRIPTEDGPSDCALFADGTRLAITHRYSENLSVVDPESGSLLSSVKLPRFQHRIAASPAGDVLAVAIAGNTPEIRFLSAESLATNSAVPLPFTPDWIAFGPGANTLLVTCADESALYRLDRSDGTSESGWILSKPLRLGSPPVTIARSPDGSLLHLAVTDFTPDGAQQGGNHFIVDQILTVDVATLKPFAQHFTAGRDSAQDSPGSTNRGVSPMAIVPRANGENALVSFAGSDEIWEMDLETHRPPKVWDGQALSMVVPHGIADLGEGAFALSSAVDGRITLIDGRAVVSLNLTSRHSGAEEEDSPNSLTEQSLQIRRGERSFHEATRSGIACQSCHPGAGSDHLTRNIGQDVPSYTLTARGTAGTSPYLRDASYPRIRDLNYHVADGLYRGYLREDPGREFDLETYIAALPRTVNPSSFEPPNLDRDRAALDLFVKADCTLCHAFPAFTNLAQHPVRTLFPDFGEIFRPGTPVDTPSLVGLWDKKNFLQDGRATELEAVFTEFNSHNRHGNTAILSGDEIRTISSFLRSL